MSSILKDYKDFVKELNGEIDFYDKKPKQEEYNFAKREEIMLRGENRRSTYSLERVCISNDRKR